MQLNKENIIIIMFHKFSMTCIIPDETFWAQETLCQVEMTKVEMTEEYCIF